MMKNNDEIPLLFAYAVMLFSTHVLLCEQNSNGMDITAYIEVIRFLITIYFPNDDLMA